MAVRRSLVCLWVVLVTATLPLEAHAQFRSLAESMFRGENEEGSAEEIETDRDSFTPSTRVVGAGRVVFEAAHSFIDNRGVSDTHSFPEILTRVGLSDDIEFRFGWNYEIGGASSPVSGNVPDSLEEEGALERSSKIYYGAKFFLTEQSQWMPESSVILQGFTPTSGESNDSSIVATYVVGWRGEQCVWDTAIRFSTGSLEEDDFNVWAPSTVLKFPVAERWKGHVEYFGLMSDGRATESSQHFFSPGAHYLINEDVEMGFRVGWGLNTESPNFFSNVGLGLRY